MPVQFHSWWCQERAWGFRYKGLTKIAAKVCLENDMAVIPAPTENPYHAENI